MCGVRVPIRLFYNPCRRVERFFRPNGRDRQGAYFTLGQMADSGYEHEAGAAPRAGFAPSWARDLLVAVRVLTRIALPLGPAPTEDDVARSRRAFPIVGLGLALVASLVYTLCRAFSLPAFPSAFFAFGALIVLTGARAEVGFAAFWEGLGRGGDPAARRAIMAEERIGYYGVLAMFFSIILRAALLAAMVRSGPAAAALAAAVAGSRAVVPVVCDRRRSPAGETLGGLAGEPGRDQIWVGAVLGALFVLFFLGPLAGLLAVAAALAVTWAIAWVTARQVGGLNPPAVATVQQAAEIVILLFAVAV